jgi:hypothetical protein
MNIGVSDSHNDLMNDLFTMSFGENLWNGKIMCDGQTPVTQNGVTMYFLNDDEETYFCQEPFNLEDVKKRYPELFETP